MTRPAVSAEPDLASGQTTLLTTTRRSPSGCTRYDVLRVNARSALARAGAARHFNRHRSTNRSEPPVTIVLSYQSTGNGRAARASFVPSCPLRAPPASFSKMRAPRRDARGLAASDENRERFPDADFRETFH